MNTLIDGLIVEDQDHDTRVARYLAFDVLFLEGTPIWQKKLEKRLQCLQNEIIVPRKNVRLVSFQNVKKKQMADVNAVLYRVCTGQVV